MNLSRRNFLGLSAGLSVSLAATTALTACTSWLEPEKKTDMRRYECQNSECEPYIYDPAVGVDFLDIPPGVPFADLPDDWVCPICGDSKRQFAPLEA